MRASLGEALISLLKSRFENSSDSLNALTNFHKSIQSSIKFHIKKFNGTI